VGCCYCGINNWVFYSISCFLVRIFWESKYTDLKKYKYSKNKEAMSGESNQSG
jgi:hypothetical protein